MEACPSLKLMAAKYVNKMRFCNLEEIRVKGEMAGKKSNSLCCRNFFEADLVYLGTLVISSRILV